MTKIYSLENLVSYARKHSPFYSELYQSLPEGNYELERLPIINRARFCTANNYFSNKLITGPMHSGTVYKSGGTTGYPKFSFFSKDEWEAFASIFGSKLRNAGLENNDRVANLFYAGDLYAAFIFYHDAMAFSDLNLLLFPIGGFTPPDEIIKMVNEFGVNVLIGVPTTMIEIADHLKRRDETLAVEKIFFSGEVMFPDQRDYIQEAMPGVKIGSIGYGSVDAGHLGFADRDCGINMHRVFSESSIMEIVDEETGNVITEQGVGGKLIYTSLTRRFMPIIRYPVGDRGMWMEEAGGVDRKFQLLGRAEDGVRLGNVTIGRQDVVDVIMKFRRRLSISNFQITIVHEETKDCLIISLASPKPCPNQDKETKAIQSDFYEQHPRLKELVDAKKIHPLRIRWISSDELQRNPRTGKLVVFNDCREEALVNS